MEQSIAIFVLVSIGSLITGLTGLGGGTLILAGLMLIYPPELAIPLHSFTQLTANGLRAGIFWKRVQWRVVGAYACLMLPFAWAAAYLFDYVNPNWLKIIVGVFILISVIPFSWKPKHEPELKTFAILGAISGFLGIFVGAVGPMVTPFFNRLKIEREGNLSTKSGGQFFLQLSKIIAFSGAAGVDFIALKSNIGLLVLGSLVGVLVSIPVGKRFSDRAFEMTVNAMLGLIALKLIYEGFTKLCGFN